MWQTTFQAKKPPATRLREQRECRDMGGTYDAEVPPVERCHLVGVQPLSRSDDGCIDGAKREIAVGADELGDSKPVAGRNGFGYQIPGGDVADEADLGLCSKRVDNR